MKRFKSTLLLLGLIFLIKFVKGKDFCNFENGDCGYSTGWNSNWKWDIASKSMPDHTTQSAKGHYYIVTNLFNPMATLESPVYRFSEPRCLTFYYWMTGKAQGYLSINLNQVYGSSSNNKDVLWKKQGDQGNQWRVAEMTIDPINLSEEYRIQFVASKLDFVNFKIAIDDISISDYPCEPTGDCMFFRDLCTWNNETVKSQDFSWKFGTVDNITKKLNSDYDHTTEQREGGFAYIETNSNNNGNKNAWLQSELMTPTGYRPLCLTFWFQIVGKDPGTLRVLVVDTNNLNNSKPFTVWEIQEATDAKEMWVFGRTSLQSLKDHYVIFEYVGGNSEEIVAIDDIIFTEGPCHSDPLHSRNFEIISTTVSPVPGTVSPISGGQNDCSFESDCKWVSDGDFKWVIGQKSTGNRHSGPDGDHTYSDGNGHYMIIKPTNNTTDLKAVLESNNINKKSNEKYGCFSFWYHMWGEDIGTLNVSQNAIDFNKELVWIRKGSQGKKWKEARITIYTYDKKTSSPFQIFIEASANGVNGRIAIDDLTYKYGACPFLANDTCTFEDSNSCNYTNPNSGYSSLKWQLQKGQDLKGKGPKTDHTFNTDYGQYAILEESDYSYPGDSGRLISPYFSSIGSMCIQFWYYIDGDDSTYITLDIEEKTIWWSDEETVGEWVGEKMDTRWHSVRVTINHYYNSKVRFLLTGNLGYNSVIAVDDIKIFEGFCGYEGDCNFDYGDRCVWSEETDKDDFDWIIGSEETQTINTGPQHDHTTRSEGGYLFIDASGRKENDTAQIYSSVFRKSTVFKCMSFWYNMYGSDIGSLNIYLKYENESAVYLLWRLQGKQDPQWNFGRFQFQGYKSNHHIIIEGVVGKGEKGDIAIDDIVFSELECSALPNHAVISGNESVVTPPPIIPPIVPPTGTPQIVKDVGYRCDFEKDDCGYSCSYSSCDWHYTKATDNIPDHSTKTSQGHYFKISEGFAELESPMFNTTVPQCLTFYYWMNGTSRASLSVYAVSKSSKKEEELLWKMDSYSNAQWRMTQTTINPTKFPAEYYLVFKSELREYDGPFDVVIDDIIISNYACEPTGDCSFNRDLCSWTTTASSSSSNLLWEFSSVNDSAIRKDHTLLNENEGGYAILEYLNYGNSSANESVFLQSQIMMPTGWEPLCLTFWVYMEGDIGRLKVLIVDADTSSSSPVWSLDTPKLGSWFYGRAALQSMNDHYVVFEYEKYANLTGVIGLDDIYFTEGPCKGDPPESHQLANISIPASTMSPPIAKGNYDCDFDINFCKWQHGKDVDLKWKRMTGKSGSYSGPSADHTSGNGYYLMLQPSKKLTGQKATIKSGNLNATNNAICLTFWYHMWGEDIDRLSVYIQYKSDDNRIEVWKRLGSQGRLWRQAQFSIMPDEKTFKIIFEGSSTKGKRGKIALDDISVSTESACRTTETEVCNFEDTNFCNYKFEEQDGEWSLMTGEKLTTSKTEGPATDHTLNSKYGHFLIADEFASITSPNYKTAGALCVRFWYNMKSPTSYEILSLRVTEYSKEFDTTYEVPDGKWGVTTDGWQAAQITVYHEAKKNVSIMFESNALDGEGEFVALDDIRIRPGFCGYEDDCNFDHNDRCHWNEDTENDDFDWFITSGSVFTANTGPSNDHTLNSPLGSYLLLDATAPRQPGDMARLHGNIFTKSSQWRCMMFWYSMHGKDVGALRIYLSERNETIIWNLKGDQGQGWQFGRVAFIGMDGPHHIIIEGIVGNGEQGDIAIDDIVFSDTKCSVFPDYAGNPVIVPTKPPLPITDISCDFEVDMCNMINEEYDVWEREKPDKNVAWHHRPSTDHSANKTGYFAYVELDNMVSLAVLQSDFVTPPACIQFWYSFYGPVVGIFEVGIMDTSTTSDYQDSKIYFSREGSQGNIWLPVKFQVDEQKPVKVNFIYEETYYYGTEGYVAIDDLRFRTGTCDFSDDDMCTFESSNICDYTQDKSSDLQWVRNRGDTASPGTGPMNDHTLNTEYGYYMYVRSFGKSNRTTRLMSKQYSVDNNIKCLHFYYHMLGKHVGSITVYVKEENGKETEIWSQSQDQGDEWNLAEANIHIGNSSSFQIIFEANTGTGSQGDMAIDDIWIENGKCPSFEQCDFEINNCMWRNDIGNEVNWTRRTGDEVEPQFDHTTSTEKGTFLYFDASYNHGAGASGRIISQTLVPKSSEKCLNFWYYLEGNMNSHLKVYMKTDSSMHLVWASRGNSFSQWLNGKVPLNEKNPYQIVIEGVHGQSFSYYENLALDDIGIQSDDCEIYPATSDPKNFADTIFNCDFENSVCNWKTDQNWKQGKSNGTLQPISNGKGNYLYLESSSGVVSFQSPIIPGENPDQRYCFKFLYYMFGPDIGTLSLLENNTETGESYLLWQRNGAQADKWFTGIVNIHKIGRKLKLIFVVEGFTYGIVALDEISVTTDDCDHGYLCDFESSSCLWLASKANVSHWHFGDGSLAANNSEFPANDHTTLSASGSYFYTTVKETEDDAKYKFIATPLYPGGFGTQCLKFWYFIGGNGNGNLSVNLMLANNSITKALWYKNGAHNGTWHYGHVTIETYIPIRVIFLAMAGSKGSNTIALDDIELEPKPCPLHETCTFDNGMCGYKTEKILSESKWLEGFGRTINPDVVVGPVEDHTSGEGFYMYVDFTNPAIATDNTATLVSDEYYGKDREPVCLQFYYLAIGSNSGSLEIQVRDTNANNETSVWQSPIPPSEMYWNCTSVPFYKNGEFEILFIAKKTDTNSFVAIDDVSVYNRQNCTCLPPKPPPTVLPPNSTFSCDFENGDTCVWTNERSSWNLKDSQTNNFGGPKYDHTTNRYKGKYLYVESNRYQSSARLVSPPLKSDALYCLKFWYFMHGSKVDTLEVLLHNSKIESTIWKKNITQSLSWRYAQLEIQQKMNYQVVFATNSTQFSEGIIGLDDIDITEGICPPQRVCTFDEDDRCGFSNAEYGTTFWTQTPKDGLPNNNLFPNDHTTDSRFGRYLYLNTSDHGNYYATIVSHLYPKTKNSCIKFWHFMRSPDSLTVRKIESSGKPSMPFSMEYEVFSPMWNGIMVPISSSGEWQFSISGSSEEAEDFIMAIDDVEVVLDQPCEPQGFCDFEADTCMWQNLNDNDYDWTRESPLDRQTSWNNVGPPIDHSNYSPLGYYMLLDHGSWNYGSALLSRIMKTEDAKCISFWFYTNAVNSYNVEVDVISRTNEYGKLLGAFPTNVTNKWTRIAFDNTVKDDFVQFRIWAKDSGYYDYLAIDDIALHNVKCAEIVESMFQCKDGQNITMDQVCDFRKQCSDGSDENNCGNCDFENDECNYSDVGNGDFRWRRNDDPLVDKNKIIQTDHNNTNGHFMVVDFALSKYYDDEAHILSPRVQFSYPSCILTFWYYLTRAEITDEALNVILINEESEEVVLLWESTRHAVANKWLQANISVGRIQHPFAVKFAAIGPYNDIVMAIDDIKFAHCQPPEIVSECPSPKFHCANQICVDRSRQCDFVDDCGDETDEINCDSELRCDFEDSFCNWKDISNYNAKWDRYYAAYYGYGPTRDHTFGTNKGNFIYTQTSYMIGKSRLAGPVLKAKPGCTFRFYYYMFGAADMDLQVLLRTFVNGTEKQIWHRKDKIADYFLKGVIPFNETSSFQIIIEADVGNQYGSVIALDDLSFDPECEIDPKPLPVAPPSPCTSGQFHCTSGQCISNALRCDFYQDCSDGSDEDSCGDCDFDNGPCGWRDSSNGAYHWILQESTAIMKLNDTFPSGDHTSGTGELMMVEKGGTGDIKLHPAILVSPELGRTAPACRLEFWYHNNDLSGIINVKLNHKQNPTLRQVITLEKSSNTSWNNQMITLGLMKAGIQVEFQAKISYEHVSTNIDLLLDDIKFHDCSLRYPMTMNEDLACNFENGLCSWYQEVAEDELNWKIGNGQQHVKGTGPEYDHTKNDGTGSYVYLESVGDELNNQKAWIVSPVQSPKKDDYCLQFYYHMFGIHINQFNVYIRRVNDSYLDLIWNKRFSQGNVWRFGERTIHSSDMPFQIIFEAVDGNGKKGDIALDDISWNKFACKEPQKFCDFESGLCDWSNAVPSDLNWIRGVNGYNSPFTGPSIDHTSGSNTGYFVFMKPNSLNTIVSGKTASFISSKFQGSKTKQCFKFWYYLSGNVGQPYASFNITIQNNTENYLKTYLSPQSSWISDSLTIESAQEYQIKITGLLWGSRSGMLALDDLVILPEACLPRGSCHFDIESNDMCDWFNTINLVEDDLDWQISSGKTPSEFTGPKVDHTLGTAEGSYIFLEAAEGKPGNIAILRSAEFYENVACFSVWYHLFGDDIGGLKIVLWTAPFSTSSIVTLFEIQGNQDDTWHSISVTIEHIPLPYRIEIWGIIGNGSKGDIAVDDFDFVSGSCKSSILTTQQTLTSSTTKRDFVTSTTTKRNFDTSTTTKRNFVSSTRSSSSTPPSECSPGYLKCNTISPYYKDCLPGILQCDGYKDCEDGSDEPEGCLKCQDGLFLCNNTDKPFCMKAEDICNNIRDCDDESDESLCECDGSTFCLNGGSCSKDKKLLSCSCSDDYSGNRCQMKSLAKEEKKEISKGWVAGVVVVIVVAAVAGIGFIYYRKKRSLVSQTPRAGISIENPVYDRNKIDDFQDFAFGDAQTSVESLKDVQKEADSEGAVNPLYGIDKST